VVLFPSVGESVLVCVWCLQCVLVTMDWSYTPVKVPGTMGGIGEKSWIGCSSLCVPMIGSASDVLCLSVLSGCDHWCLCGACMLMVECAGCTVLKTEDQKLKMPLQASTQRAGMMCMHGGAGVLMGLDHHSDCVGVEAPVRPSV